LLNALESLSVSIGFVSTAVEMVRDALLAAPDEEKPDSSLSHFVIASQGDIDSQSSSGREAR
jgi:hypothetical protein